jgi:hypothetical protein
MAWITFWMGPAPKTLRLGGDVSKVRTASQLRRRAHSPERARFDKTPYSHGVSEPLTHP